MGLDRHVLERLLNQTRAEKGRLTRQIELAKKDLEFTERELLALEAEMRQQRKRVHLIAILDKSASMSHLTTDTIGGFNTFIEEQRKTTDTDLEATLVQFASPERRVAGIAPVGKGDYQVTFRAKPISEVTKLTRESYRANGGSTALNDAIGKTLTEIDTSTADAFVVLVITDGFENDSVEYTREAVRELIKAREAAGNFTFVFIGSDPSTWGEAAAYGTTVSNTMSYSPDSAGVQHSYLVASRGLDMLRSNVSTGVGATMDSFVKDAEASLQSNPAPDPTIIRTEGE
jgi:hypothetical protein